METYPTKPRLAQTLVFRLGLLGFLCFAWAWIYSTPMEHATAIMAGNAKGQSLYGGLVYGKLYLSRETAGPFLPTAPRDWSVIRGRCPDDFWGHPSFTLGKPVFGPHRQWFTIPLWLPWLLYGLCWALALWWRSRRLR